MRAVIMAGGEGTRLRPLTITRPKPMAHVVGKPIMEYIIELLVNQGFRDITATLYYLPEIIQEYFDDGSSWNVKLDYSIEETPLGTAGSVKYALRDKKRERILIISGDALTDIDLNKVLEFHEEKGALVTIVLKSVENPLEYGVVITNEDGRIIKFLEKPGWGEVFSDTVNTGIYILEPEVLDYIPENTPFDFSKDLFPLLLSKNAPLYGYISDCYWCDIGDLNQFLQANFDVLNQKVKVKISGREIYPGIFAKEGIEIFPTAYLKPPVYVGQFTRIMDNAHIRGPVVLGDNVFIDSECKIERSVVFNNTYIGKKTSIFSAIVGNRCNIKDQVRIEEGAIIGDNTNLGGKVFVNNNVKIWPNKIVETGTFVNSSIIWGSHWRKTFFGQRGISGMINVEITPELATKIGSAFGTVLPKGSDVVMSRDIDPACRMIKRALLTGILSTGVHVYDIRTLPIPVSKYSVPNLLAKAGVHVRLSPYDNEKILIEFFDENGVSIDKSTERKIENILFREDFRRTYAKEVGEIKFPPHIIEYYLMGLLKKVDTESIKKKNFKIIVDYKGSSISLILPHILSNLKIENLSLNLYGENLSLTSITSSESLSNLVKSFGADLGVVFTHDGENFSLFTPQGNYISKDTLIATIALLNFKTFPNSQIVVPVTVSNMIEKLAEIEGGRVYRSKTSPSELVKATLRIGAKLGASEDGIIYPEFQLSFDGIYGFIKTLELLSKTGYNIDEIFMSLPNLYKVKNVVDCPIELKGKIMRKIIEENIEQSIDYTDGIKINFGESWVLILPHPEDPAFEVYAEATSLKDAQDLCKLFSEKITSLIG
ncbi:MAG: mannose-1-phosphate guanyltransferase [Dictyoglomus sp. NZ13-RE01]|nr:MAG: mannose-1-phosphate guanyltransferase [Dictyoglomus sp. NZ13-RE01]